MQSRRFNQVLIVCLCCLAGISAYPESPTPNTDQHPVAVVDNLNQPFDLGPFLETIEDPNHEYTLEDIEAGRYEHLWLRNTARTFIGKNVKSKYWFRLTIHWQGRASENSVLSLNNHPGLLARLGMVLPEQNGRDKKIITTGNLEPYSSHAFSSLRFAFPLLLTTNQSTALVGWVANAESGVPVQLPFNLQSEAIFTETSQQFSALLIAFYAAMGALFLYNLCLFFTLRHSMYLLYLVFIGGVLLTCSLMDGFANEWVWPALPQLRYRLNNICGVLAGMAYLTFVLSALNSLRGTAYSKLYLCLMGLGVLCSGVILFSDSLVFRSAISEIYSGLIMPVTLVIILHAWARRVSTAGYLLIAEVSMITGGISFLLMIHGLLPINNITLWSLHMGFGSEAFLLSLALAERTRLAQQSSIQNLKKYEALYDESIEGRFQFFPKNGTTKMQSSHGKNLWIRLSR